MRTGLWKNDRVPKGDWTCAEVNDLGVARATCQMCLTANIRFVHTVTHPKSHTLRVGVCCAGHMEGSPEGARPREQVYKLAQARKGRWIDREWKRSKRGVLYTNGDGFNIRIYPVVGGYGGVISSLANDWKLTSQHVHASEAKAQAAALKAMFAKRPETSVSK